MKLTRDELRELVWLNEVCDPAPWRAMVEDRDFSSGDSFIQTGVDSDRGEDIYITRDSGPAGPAYLDLIAKVRNLLPILLEEFELEADQLATVLRNLTVFGAYRFTDEVNAEVRSFNHTFPRRVLVVPTLTPEDVRLAPAQITEEHLFSQEAYGTNSSLTQHCA